MLAFQLHADESSTPLASIKNFESIQMTELKLKNGMRFILKSTDDEGEICVRFAALGGSSSLHPSDRASGELAAPLVIESGLGDLCADKLSAFLYSHSIELNLKIEPYTRSIEASLPEESLDAFFKLVHLTFTDPQFSQEAFQTLLAKQKLAAATKTIDQNLNEILNLSALKEKSPFYPLTMEDLNKTDFQTTKEFFLEAFSDPNDFICVIAGNFNLEKAKDLIIHNFSLLPPKATSLSPSFPLQIEAPKYLISKVQSLPRSQESLVKLALPLQIILDSDRLEQLEISSQIIETRLRNAIKKSRHTKELDVWYEMPFYPSLQYPWLTIQFRNSNPNIQNTLSLILEEVKQMYQKGLSQQEVEQALKTKQRSLKLWEHENDYWMVLLSNHYLWGWDPQKIATKFKDPTVMNSKAIHSTLQKALLEEYKSK